MPNNSKGKPFELPRIRKLRGRQMRDLDMVSVYINEIPSAQNFHGSSQVLKKSISNFVNSIKPEKDFKLKPGLDNIQEIQAKIKQLQSEKVVQKSVSPKRFYRQILPEIHCYSNAFLETCMSQYKSRYATPMQVKSKRFLRKRFLKQEHVTSNSERNSPQRRSTDLKELFVPKTSTPDHKSSRRLNSSAKPVDFVQKTKIRKETVSELAKQIRVKNLLSVKRRPSFEDDRIELMSYYEEGQVEQRVNNLKLSNITKKRHKKFSQLMTFSVEQFTKPHENLLLPKLAEQLTKIVQVQIQKSTNPILKREIDEYQNKFYKKHTLSQPYLRMRNVRFQNTDIS